MGAGTSTDNIREDAGRQIFELAEKMFPNVPADEITGVVIDTTDEDLHTLLNDPSGSQVELKKRIRTAAKLILKKQMEEKTNKKKNEREILVMPTQADHNYFTNGKQSCEMPRAKSCFTANNASAQHRPHDIIIQRQLCELLLQQWSGEDKLTALEAEEVSQMLVNSPETERNQILSHEKRLRNYVRTELDRLKKTARWRRLCKEAEDADEEQVDEMELVDKYSRVHLAEFNPDINELSEHEMEEMVKVKLFERVQQVFPNHADILTGILIESVTSDILLHVLSSDEWMYKCIGQTLEEMITEGGVDGETVLKENIGEVLYKRMCDLYPDETEDTWSKLTGVLLEIGLVELCDLLANPVELKRRAEIVLELLEET